MSLTPMPAPKVCSPIAAAVASLSIATGRPKRSATRSRSGTSLSGRLTDSTTFPCTKSTIDGVPMPMPSTAAPSTTSASRLSSSSRQAASDLVSVGARVRFSTRSATACPPPAPVAPGGAARTSATSVFVPPISTATSVLGVTIGMRVHYQPEESSG